MKSKTTKVLFSVLLVIVLCFSFVACDPKEEKKEEPATMTELLDEMTGKLASDLTITNPRRLNVDINGIASLKEVASTTGDLWKYQLIAKANIGLDKSSAESDTNFRIELNTWNKNAEGVEEKVTLFSLLYEAEFDKDSAYTGSYFYIMIPGSVEPMKVPAIAMLKLIPGVDQEIEPIDIASYINIVARVMFNDEATKDGNNYQFSIDLQKVWDFVGLFLTNAIEDPDSLASLIPGIDVKPIFAAIDGIIPELFGNLTYMATPVDDEETADKDESLDDPATPDVDESAPKEANVKDLASFVEYLNQNMPSVMIAMNFKFDDKNAFTGADVTAKYQEKNDEGVYDKPTHNFTLDLQDFLITSGGSVAYDEGYVLDAVARKALLPTGNIAKFSIDGKIKIGGAGYTYAIDADINPFIFFGDFKMSNLKDLGYFSLILTRDNVDVEIGDLKNVLNLIIDSEKEEILISYLAPGHNNSAGDLGIGGVYGFEDLGKIIEFLTPAKPDEPTTPVADTATTDIISGIIEAFTSRLDVSNIIENGVVINGTEGLIKDLLVAAGLDKTIGGFFGMVVEAINGWLFTWSDDLVIMVDQDGFKYNQCDKVDVNTLTFEGSYYNVYSEMLDSKKRVSTNAIQTTYEFGEAFNVTYDTTMDPKYNHERAIKDGSVKMPAKAVDNSFDIKGYNRAGKSNQTYKAVFYGSNYDPKQAGKQEVTVYYGINSRLAELFSNGMIGGTLKKLVPQSLPLFGIHTMTVNVVVKAKVDTDHVFLRIDGSNKMFAKQDIASILDSTMLYTDGNGETRSVKVTNDMISCKQPVITTEKDGKKSFDCLGKFVIDINYKGITISQQVLVSELQASSLGEKLIPGKTLAENAGFKVRILDANGNIEESDVKVTVTKCDNGKAIEDAAYVDYMDQVFDNNGKVKCNFNMIYTDLYLSYSYKIDGKTYTIEKQMIDGIDVNDVEYNADKTSIATGAITYASNSDLTQAKKFASSSYLGKITRNELGENGTTVSVDYFVTYDKVNNKFVANSEDKTYKDAGKVEHTMVAKAFDKTFTLVITRTATWNVDTLKNDTMLVAPETITLSATEYTLDAGAYEFLLTIDGFGFAVAKSDIKPIVYYNKNATTGNYTSISSLLVLNIDATVIDGAPDGAKSLKFIFDKKSKSWKIGYDKPATSASVNVTEADKSILSYTLSVKDAEGKEITEYKENYGYFLTDPTGSTISLTMTFGGQSYTISETVQ